MSFKRSLGPIGLMFAAVSGMMGSAWLFGPYYAARMSGSGAILAWVIGGIAMMVIALTLAELVCMFPISGGNARFMHFTHGTLSSFIFSWIMWLGYAAVAPVETMGVLQYLSSVFPSLTLETEGVVVLSHTGYVVAACVLFLMCILNFLSVKWVSIYNSAVVWLKLLVPVIVAVALLTIAFHWSNFTAGGGFLSQGVESIESTLSLGGVIFAFAGYAPAIVLAGEARNPQRTVPIVLVSAILICLIIYVLLQTAFIGVLDPALLANGWPNLTFAHDASPFVGIGEQHGLETLNILIFITAILAPLGTAFIFIATSSRVAFAMSQNGYFPHLFMFLNQKGVPVIAVTLNFFVGLLLFFPSPGWQGMVGFLVSAFVLCYVIGPVSLLTFRRVHPGRRRPFKLPFATLLSFIAFFVATLIVYWTGWGIISKMMIALLIGFVVLVLMRGSKWGKKKAPRLDITAAGWVIFYFIGMTVISYLGNYGDGQAVLPEGWDILIVAIFSGICLIWSQVAKLTREQSIANLGVLATHE